jgi:DNA-binding beta-propeller fold protein YncE
VGARIEGIALSPNGREVWVAGNESHLVYILDAERGTTLATLDGFGFPYRIGFTPDGKTAVVSDPGAERVHLIDVASRKARAVLDMTAGGDAAPAGGGPSPQGVAVAADGTAYVTLKARGQVAVIDVVGARVLKTLTVGGGSDGVGVSALVRKQ